MLGVLALAACNVLTGLSDYTKVDCVLDCEAGTGTTPDVATIDATPRGEGGLLVDAGDGGDVPSADADAAPVPPELFWARWRMPNPADAGVDANIASYSVDDAGVVTDIITNLQWMQQTSSAIMIADARAYCQTQTGSWRLPTRIELASLIDFTRSPSIDPIAFPGTAPEEFWTASPVSGTDASSYWNVDFNQGAVSSSGGLPTRRVRCVRGGTQ